MPDRTPSDTPRSPIGPARQHSATSRTLPGRDPNYPITPRAHKVLDVMPDRTPSDIPGHILGCDPSYSDRPRQRPTLTDAHHVFDVMPPRPCSDKPRSRPHLPEQHPRTPGARRNAYSAIPGKTWSRSIFLGHLGTSDQFARRLRVQAVYDPIPSRWTVPESMNSHRRGICLITKKT